MMVNASKIPQLFLRMALGIGFILPVMDRLGCFGAPGTPGVAWGNWPDFVSYTNVLLPFLGRSAAGIMATLATIGETLFGVLLITGYKTKLAAFGTFLLTLCFAICMGVFVAPRSPFSYSVFVDSAAGLLLATIPSYQWSIDYYLAKKDVKH